MRERPQFVSLSVLEVLRRSTEYLGQGRSDSPRLEAEILLAHVLGLRRIDLYLQFDRPLAEAELTHARLLLKRRSSGAPVAYLVGEREFYGLAFAVRPGVLIPRPESELLVEIGLRRLGGGPGRTSCADLGTGSGALGVTIASSVPWVRVDAVDVAEVAVEVARDNARRLGVSDRFTVLQGSWARAV
jgi:release factor glutamine methyltransferase